MNPEHLELLRDRSDLKRHRIAFALTQHGSTQRGVAADDMNELSAADRLHAAPIQAKKELMLLVVGTDQTDPLAELYSFAGDVGVRRNWRQLSIAWRRLRRD